MKKYLYLGILWTVLGVGSMVFDFVHDPPYFTVFFGPIVFPLGILLIMFGGLNLLNYHILYRQSLFTEEEAAQYVGALDHAMPDIIDGIQSGKAVEDIAKQVEHDYGIPPLITLKYILALGRIQKKL